MKYLSILALMILSLSSLEAKSNPKKYIEEGRLELFDHGMYWTKLNKTYRVQALYFDEPRGCYYTFKSKLKKLRLKSINNLGRWRKPVDLINLSNSVKLFDINQLQK